MTPAPGDEHPPDQDDTLTLLFLCCHPALSPPSQVALTLRAVGGLTTAQIASAFLVPEATMAQRISRAKQRIKAAGVPFRLPPEPERAERLRVVLHVLYLIFNEGYTASSGPGPAARAISPTRRSGSPATLHRLLPDDGEVAGLLALMLLTDARRAARTGADGALVPLAEQDRDAVGRGSHRARASRSSRDTLARAPVGPYQLQAAIAAVHDEAARAEDTDWRQILALYELLDTRTQSDGHPQPRRRGRHGGRPRPGSTCSNPGRPTAGAAPPPGRGPRTPAGDGRRPSRRPRVVPAGRPAHHQPPRTALPRDRAARLAES